MPGKMKIIEYGTEETGSLHSGNWNEMVRHLLHPGYKNNDDSGMAAPVSKVRR
jgi:hypothetical protein